MSIVIEGVKINDGSYLCRRYSWLMCSRSIEVEAITADVEKAQAEKIVQSAIEGGVSAVDSFN